MLTSEGADLFGLDGPGPPRRGRLRRRQRHRLRPPRAAGPGVRPRLPQRGRPLDPEGRRLRPDPRERCGVHARRRAPGRARRPGPAGLREEPWPTSSRARRPSTTRRSSSAPACPASTSCTGCSSWASTPSSLEAADGLGGTWYHNRYPGCRFDSESYTYGYSFSQELLDDWDWTEHFAAQPETLRYLEPRGRPVRPAPAHAVRLHGRARPTYDEDARTWTVQVADGRTFTLPVPASPPSACCPRRPCPASRGSSGSGARRSTPTTGPTSRSTSPASGWRSSAPAPPPCSSSPRSPARPRRALRLPAPSQLVRAAAQRPDRRRGDGRDQGVATTRSSSGAGRRRAASSTSPTAAGPSRCPTRSATSSTRSSTRRPASASGRATSATCCMDEAANAEFTEFVADKIRERVDDPVARREADPEGPRVRHPAGARWRPTTTRPTTGTTSTSSTSTRRRSSASPRPASGPPSATTTST